MPNPGLRTPGLFDEANSPSTAIFYTFKLPGLVGIKCSRCVFCVNDRTRLVRRLLPIRKPPFTELNLLLSVTAHELSPTSPFEIDQAKSVHERKTHGPLHPPTFHSFHCAPLFGNRHNMSVTRLPRHVLLVVLMLLPLTGYDCIQTKPDAFTESIHQPNGPCKSFSVSGTQRPRVHSEDRAMVGLFPRWRRTRSH